MFVCLRIILNTRRQEPGAPLSAGNTMGVAHGRGSRAVILYDKRRVAIVTAKAVHTTSANAVN